MNPLEIQRLARRIEALQRQSTTGWVGGDDMILRNALPNARTRQALPDPAKLREQAVGPVEDHPEMGDFRRWLRLVLHLEGLVHDNRPGNMSRIMRDMARGRTPRW